MTRSLKISTVLFLFVSVLCFSANKSLLNDESESVEFEVLETSLTKQGSICKKFVNYEHSNSKLENYDLKISNNFLKFSSFSGLLDF